MIKVIVLGTAQDGGVPHLGCAQPFCERARREPSFARWVACLGVIDTDAQQSFLIDATPDVRPQLDYLVRHLDAPHRADRNPVDGLILTHAHIGHYTGLIQFGKEVMATRGLPTYCTPRMADFLRGNGPWSQLVRDGHLALCEIPNWHPEPAEGPQFQIPTNEPTDQPTTRLTDQPTIRLTDQLTMRPFLVPHRQEWSDTIGLELIGPTKRLIYIPDIDRWSDWERDVCTVVASCDIALLDGCFYAGDELPGRDMSQVPHPLIAESLLTLHDSARKVYFTHLNHTNPALDPDSSQRREIEARGFHVAEERMEFVL